MAVTYDKLLGKTLLHSHLVDLSTSNPSNPKDGRLYFNTNALELRIYYNGTWYALSGSSGGGGTAGQPVGLLLAITKAS